jgi:glycosyltransferase involved in cell wall biosynthesis
VTAPVYNEAECIEEVVRYWDKVLEGWPLTSEIVLTNDGSVDATGSILDRLMTEIPRLRVIHREKNSGYGGAVASSIAGSRGRLVVTLDSDGQFDLAEARRLIEHLERHSLDAVVGRRDGKRDSFARVLADRVLNRMVRLMFGVRLRDTQCALKVIRGDLARGLTLEARGFPNPTEIVLKLGALGAKLGEQTVTHAERKAGASKLKVFRTGMDTWRFLWYLRRRIKLYRRRVIQRL